MSPSISQLQASVLFISFNSFIVVTDFSRQNLTYIRQILASKVYPRTVRGNAGPPLSRVCYRILRSQRWLVRPPLWNLGFKETIFSSSLTRKKISIVGILRDERKRAGPQPPGLEFRIMCFWAVSSHSFQHLKEVLLSYMYIQYMFGLKLNNNNFQ